MDQERVIEHERTIVDLDANVFAVKWSMDDSQIATAGSNGTIKIYSAATGNWIRTLNCRIGIDALPVTSIQFRPLISQAKTKHVLVATTAEGYIIHWHSTSGKILHTIGVENSQVLSVNYDSEGKYFAVGCEDMHVRVYDESTKTLISDMLPGEGERSGHGNRIFKVRWFGDQTVISGGWDNNVLIWDVRTRRVQKCIYGPHICGDAIDVKGNELLTGSYTNNDQIQIWTLPNGENVFTSTLRNENKPCMLYAAQYSKFDSGAIFAVGGSGSNEAYFYDSLTLRPFAVLSNLTKSVYGIDFANTSNRAAICSGDDTVRVFEISKSRIVSEA
ncbi:unnamed protein product [Blepharisma stoltei]|uniref:Anaphase-promoting complex subunit 4-like WD40 domain-containing protein n=1 Tax=Blepharisma stoltei TaxID=1481888 RepID=A0AAU9K7J0_9CILI|nr:unnamed protein product [Blepharisma stoltei]